MAKVKHPRSPKSSAPLKDVRRLKIEIGLGARGSNSKFGFGMRKQLDLVELRMMHKYYRELESFVVDAAETFFAC